MKHLGDITKLSGYEVPIVDVITGGSPCQDLSIAGKRAGLAGERSGLFMEQMRIVKEMREQDERTGRPAQFRRCRFMVWENVCFAPGTLITCADGYKPIERVAVGDKVKTHTGRYMPVVKTHKTKDQPIIRLKVSGSEDLLVTANHPFLAREKTYRGTRRTICNPEWTAASKLTKNHLIAYKIDEPTLPENFMTISEAFAVGRWLADGSVDLTKSNPRIFMSCGVAKAEELRKRLRETPYDIHENHPHKTAINFCFTSRNFYSLIAAAGVGALHKVIPPYVFELPFSLQKAVLEGYLSGDGYTRDRNGSTEITASTSSRLLAYGIARLIRNVYRVTANVSTAKRKNGNIGGRTINCNATPYRINACVSKSYSTGCADNNYVWQPVFGICQSEETSTVYNLSVLEDNTYGANDIVVHNCGALSSGKPKGADFQAVLQEICRIVCKEATVVPIPDAGWPGAGCLNGVGDNGIPFSVAWRIHDAQFWGVPQRRRRICVLADFNGTSAARILFYPQFERTSEGGKPISLVGNSGDGPGPEVPPVGESLSGDSESGGEAREAASEGTGGSAESAVSFQERAGKPGGARDYSCRMSEQEPCQPSTTRAYSIQGNTIDRDAKQGGGV